MAGEAHRIPIANVLDDGWRSLTPEGQEEIRKMVAEAADTEHAASVASAYAKLFNSRAGRLVMEDLLRLVWFHPGFDGTLGFERAAAFGIERDGMKKLVHYIQFKTAVGKGDA